MVHLTKDWFYGKNQSRLLKITIYFLKQLYNFRNRRYDNYRKILSVLLILLFFFVLFSILNNSNTQSGLQEVIEDILFYLILVILIAESFYRRIRYEAEIYMEAIQEQIELNNNYVSGDIVHLDNGEIVDWIDLR